MTNIIINTIMLFYLCEELIIEKQTHSTQLFVYKLEFRFVLIFIFVEIQTLIPYRLKCIGIFMNYFCAQVCSCSFSGLFLI
jgi:hypothetical protein